MHPPDQAEIEKCLIYLRIQAAGLKISENSPCPNFTQFLATSSYEYEGDISTCYILICDAKPGQR
jgi:hypothetical protein